MSVTDEWPDDLRCYAEDVDEQTHDAEIPQNRWIYLVTREVYFGLVFPMPASPKATIRFKKREHPKVVRARDRLHDELVPVWRQQIIDGRDPNEVIAEGQAYLGEHIQRAGLFCDGKTVIDALRQTDELGDTGYVVSGAAPIIEIHRMRH
jgi:hypothetical protein